jgi:hypothetical protein
VPATPAPCRPLSPASTAPSRSPPWLQSALRPSTPDCACRSRWLVDPQDSPVRHRLGSDAPSTHRLPWLAPETLRRPRVSPQLLRSACIWRHSEVKRSMLCFTSLANCSEASTVSSTAATASSKACRGPAWLIVYRTTNKKPARTRGDRVVADRRPRRPARSIRSDRPTAVDDPESRADEECADCQGPGVLDAFPLRCGLGRNAG